jgi:hypothetical protein
MRILVAQQAPIMEEQLRQRLKEIDRNIERLRREHDVVAQRLKLLETSNARASAAKAPLVACPKCGRDRDFMIDRGGFLGHVLEDADDVEDLEPGKPIFCPACGEVFLYGRTTVAPKKGGR